MKDVEEGKPHHIINCWMKVKKVMNSMCKKKNKGLQSDEEVDKVVRIPANRCWMELFKLLPCN